MTEKEKGELFGVIEQLMTPERATEVKKFIDSMPPVFQQFFLRFMEFRDMFVWKEMKTYLDKDDDDSFQSKIADRIYDKLAEYNKPVLEKLGKISDDIGDIKERLILAEVAVKEERKRIEDHELRLIEKKRRIERLEMEMSMLQPESIKMVADEIQEIKPILLWFKNAFKWYKIVVYIALVTGLWSLIHLLFMSNAG